MTIWLRLYIEALDDPKVQRLPDSLFKTWINILMLTKKHDGALPPLDVAAYVLRLPVKELAKRIETLIKAGLIDRMGDDLAPHNWSERQYESDSSTKRSRRFREKRDVACNVAATLHATSPPRDGDGERDVSETAERASRDRERNGQDAVAATPPESESESDTESSSSIRTEAARDDDDLRRKLKEAANDHLERGCANIKPIRDLIDGGCDLELDVLPCIRERVPKLLAPLKTWSAGWLAVEILDASKTRKAAAASSGQASPRVRSGEVFVAKDAPDWAAAAKAWRKRSGKTFGPPADARNPTGQGSPGWYFPVESPRTDPAQTPVEEAAE